MVVIARRRFPRSTHRISQQRPQYGLLAISRWPVSTPRAYRHGVGMACRTSSGAKGYGTSVRSNRVGKTAIVGEMAWRGGPGTTNFAGRGLDWLPCGVRPACDRARLGIFGIDLELHRRGLVGLRGSSRRVRSFVDMACRHRTFADRICGNWRLGNRSVARAEPDDHRHSVDWIAWDRFQIGG